MRQKCILGALKISETNWLINAELKTQLLLGRGGGLVVSALAYCSEDPSSNPADCWMFILQKDKNKWKKAGVGPLKKLYLSFQLI